MENVVLTKRLIPDILRASVYLVHVLSCEAHEHPCIPSSTSVLYGSFKVAFNVKRIAVFNLCGKSVEEHSRSVFTQGRVKRIKIFNFFVVVMTIGYFYTDLLLE